MLLTTVDCCWYTTFMTEGFVHFHPLSNTLASLSMSMHGAPAGQVSLQLVLMGSHEEIETTDAYTLADLQMPCPQSVGGSCSRRSHLRWVSIANLEE